MSFGGDGLTWWLIENKAAPGRKKKQKTTS